MYCINCGEKLVDNAKFCSRCGTTTYNSDTAAKINYEATRNKQNEVMVQCPNCGASISRLDATCRFCGAQIADKKASKTVTQFAEELMRIEESAPDEVSSSGVGLGLLNLYPKEYRQEKAKAMEKAYGSKTFEKKLSLIKSFPIPNSIEEISEFVLLAIANINVEYGKKSLGNSLWGTPGGVHYTEVTLANTWISKMEQAYHKAEIAFPNDPIFQNIKNIYESKMKELKRI